MTGLTQAEHSFLRYSSLNHWRGIAALMVVAFHTSWATSWAGSPTPAFALSRSICSVGWSGVHLFFVISGYCIAANIHYRTIHQQPASSFIKDRFLRIYPPYWAALGVSICLGFLFSPFSHAGDEVKLFPTPQVFLTNLALIEPYCGTPSALIVSWTLVYEFGFYLLVAVGLAIFNRFGLGRFWVGSGVCLAFASFLKLPQPAFLVLNYWPEFLCGALIYLARLERLRNHHRCRWLYLLLIPVLAVMGLFVSHSERAGHFLIAGPFALLLYFLAPFDEQIVHARLLRWLGFIGAFSYSLYLIHATLLVRMSNFARRFVAPESAILGWIFLGMALGSVVGGYVFYQLCEVPLEVWRRHLRHTGSSRLDLATISGRGK